MDYKSERRRRYEKYIASPEWAAKRQERLELDKHRCRTCRSTESLHVHHVVYDNLGNEPMKDLITLCQRCHDAIHTLSWDQGKYEDITHTAAPHQSQVVEIKDQSNVRNLQVKAHKRRTLDLTQRSDSRSVESLLERTKADQQQKKEDRRRLGRTIED